MLFETYILLIFFYI